MRVCSKCCKFNIKHSGNIFARGLSAYRARKLDGKHLCNSFATGFRLNIIGMVQSISGIFIIFARGLSAYRARKLDGKHCCNSFATGFRLNIIGMVQSIS